MTNPTEQNLDPNFQNHPEKKNHKVFWRTSYANKKSVSSTILTFYSAIIKVFQRISSANKTPVSSTNYYGDIFGTTIVTNRTPPTQHGSNLLKHHFILLLLLS